MLVFAYSTRKLKTLTRTDLLLVIVSGVMLSLHFATFIVAVKFTTVANATFLVSTSPVMLAVLSPILIRERTTSREGVGVIIATLGILLVANAGNGFRSFGLADFSALLAAMFVSFYSIIGRFLRTHGVSTACYTAYVYSIATIVTFSLVEMLGSNTFRAYDATNAFAILSLALIPTLLGHSLYNYSLGSVKAVTANLFPLLEPILSSTFAVPLFGEIPTLTQLIGYLLILFTVVIVVTASNQSSMSKVDSVLKYTVAASKKIDGF
jgi:drug/metabolite transporter (DMT)-like permease